MHIRQIPINVGINMSETGIYKCKEKKSMSKARSSLKDLYEAFGLTYKPIKPKSKPKTPQKPFKRVNIDELIKAGVPKYQIPRRGGRSKVESKEARAARNKRYRQSDKGKAAERAAYERRKSRRKDKTGKHRNAQKIMAGIKAKRIAAEKAYLERVGALEPIPLPEGNGGRQSEEDREV